MSTRDIHAEPAFGLSTRNDTAPDRSGSTSRAPSAEAAGGGGRSRDAARRGPAVWRLVAQREVLVKLRDRNFLVATAVLLVLLVLSLGFQVLIAQQSGKTSVGVVSGTASAVVKDAGSLADDAGTSVSFDAKRYDSVRALEAGVRDGSVDAGLVADGASWRLIGKDDKNSTLATWVRQSVAASALARNAATAGTTPEALAQGSQVDYTLLRAPGDRRPNGTLIAAVFGLLFYLGALVFGTAIANSVVEEKQNRIVEILAAAIPVRQLLIGKVVGNAFLALAQVLLIAVIGAGGLLAIGQADALAQVAAGSGWFLAFFLVGFAALACLWAVVGALAGRSEDIASTSPPMTMLLMGVFFAGLLATGTAQTVLSFLPIFSTIAMPTRVIAGDASWWQATLSLVISGVGAWLIILVAERMYRRSLMQTSRRTTFREALGGLRAPATGSEATR